MGAKASSFALMLLSLLALPAAAGAAGQRSEPSSAALVWVTGSEADSLAADVEKVVERYESFVMVRLTRAQSAALAARGLAVDDIPEPGVVRIGGRDLVASRDLDAGFRPGPALLRLVGPPRPDWVAHLRGLGLTILEYRAPFAYVVGGSQSALRDAARASFVAEAGTLPAWARIDPELAALASESRRPWERVAVAVLLRGDVDLDMALHRIAALGGILLRSESVYDNPLTFWSLPLRHALRAATLPETLWVERHAPPRLADEVQDQIIAGAYTTGPGPTGPGYAAQLAARAADGTGVQVSVVDTGIDSGVDNPSVDGDMHPELDNRVDFLKAYSGCGPGGAADRDGHGTHVAGIVGASGSLGSLDGAGYNHGLGVAPAVHFSSLKIFGPGGFCSGASYTAIAADGYNNGAEISQNSWGADTTGSYTSSSASFDSLTRDAVGGTAGNQQLLFVFASGNDGWNSASQSVTPGTVGSPASGKNVLTVGASLNYRPTLPCGNCWPADNMDAMVGFSSRGPTDDGRFKPDVVAPGTYIGSTKSQETGIGDGWGAIDTYHQYIGGTSQATPAVSGATALFYQRYKAISGGLWPSPAQAKAAMVNGAVDMPAVGSPSPGAQSTGPVPNNDEGWGRVNLKDTISTGRPFIYLDQSVKFTASGGAPFEIPVRVAPGGGPFKVTLAWTDRAAAAGCDPCLVNNLDLEVVAPDSTLYRGNVFSGGVSTTGGSADSLNNLENVLISSPTPGTWTLRVKPVTIAQNALNDACACPTQDFALAVRGAGYPLDALPGRNLAGFPAMNATRVASDFSLFLSAGDSVSKWNPAARSYTTFVTGTDVKGNANDFSLTMDQGIWVNNTGLSTKTILLSGVVAGPLWSRAAPVSAGLNLVSYDSISSRGASAWAAGIAGTTLTYMLAWDASTQSYPPNRLYIPGRTASFTVSPGMGVWVFVPGAGSLGYAQ
jgi:subtilisin family serine protease